MADWEAIARDHFAAAAGGLARAAGFELLPAPALDPQRADELEAHMGLYERVAQSVFVYGRGDQDAWAHKQHEFDYTLGPGLAFLREQTGADAALIVLGSDYISSGGRRAAFVAGLVLGIVMPLGQSFVTAGLVDLASGDVLWMSFDSSATLDSRARSDVEALMRDLALTWPVAP
jgi:hypothetical protein